MKTISISDEISVVCPELCVGAISCEMVNTSSDTVLWEEIRAYEAFFRNQYKIEDINKRPTIKATREAYKKLGKDPNRYRPSSEALCRRILRGIPLYQINTLVDLINLISLESGYSIGAFDESLLVGDDLVLGVGKEGEPYEGIGRGLLNIHGLPVYRDELGGIGTPTSDVERTKVSLYTNRLLMIINGYSGEEGLSIAMDRSVDLLKKYVSAANLCIKQIYAK